MHTTNTVRKMFADMGYDFNQMKIGEPVELTKKWEILSLDSEGNESWNRVLKIVRKPNAPHMLLSVNEKNLSCSPDHKVFVRNIDSKVETWEEVAVLFQNETSFEVKTSQGWSPFSIVMKAGEIEIADMEVENVNSYLSNGILSHNTMYGDPNTTSGGMAIPYAASVRIKLNGGKPLLDADDNTYGIEVTAKTIKNKTSKPFRECTFQIHFGKGIVEHENIFDFLRAYYEKKPATIVNGVAVNVSGGGAWKIFQGSDVETGEVLFEKKFHKNDFGKMVLYNAEYKKYVDAMMEDAYVIKPDETDHPTDVGVDDSSVEELEALRAEAEEGE